MTRLRHFRTLGLLCVVMVVVAAACSSSSKKSSTGGGTSGSTAAPAAVKQGGAIVISAEQEPDCMDWIGSCASAAWGIWGAQIETMPEAYTYDNTQGWIPSPVLSGPADVVTSPQLKVTYHINPKA
ncbi:MAG TPA: hypothetical protein VGI06_11600, partial [Acidimicrobiales bacterium]